MINDQELTTKPGLPPEATDESPEVVAACV